MCLAAVSAILLGLILGSLPKVFQFINPILQIIRPIAPVAFLPFIVFWFGIGDVPAIVIIFIAGFFPILLSVVAAVQLVDGIYYKIANSFGVGKVKTLFGIGISGRFLHRLQMHFACAWNILDFSGFRRDGRCTVRTWISDYGQQKLHAF